MPDVLFCHGLESGPQGRKYHALVEAGFGVTAPDFRGQMLAARVTKLLGILDEELPAVLIGSSYGGITAVCAQVIRDQKGLPTCPMVLCAPALARAESPARELDLAPPSKTTIVHGRDDTLIPVSVSEQWTERSPDLVTLRIVEDGHSLAQSLDTIVSAVRELL